MIVAILVFFISLGILIKGADLFVESSVKIAKHFNISDFIIGLTLVAIGTSLPELANAIVASFTNNSTIMLGNITGANIINLCLNLGIAAFIGFVVVDKEILKREAIFLFVGPLLLFLFVADKNISRLEGLIFLVLFLIYMMEIFELRKYLKSLFLRETKEELKHIEDENVFSDKPKENIWLNFLIFAVSCFLVFISANYLVKSTADIATMMNIPASIIAFLIIALGTTLPEMMVTFTAIKKKNSGLMIGNVIGSNIVNIFFIIGLGATIRPFEIGEMSQLFTIPFLIFITALFIIFVATKNKLGKIEGAILILSYILFLIFLGWKLFGWFF